jgi:hypothetical protein
MVLIATVFTLPVMAVGVGIMNAKSLWISDDAIMQQAVWNWQQGQPRNITFGEDTFVLKYPFYSIINRALPHSPTALLVTTVTFLITMIILFNIFQFLFHKSLRFGILLSMYIASFGGLTLLSMAMPNTRNLEMSLALLTALVVALYYSDRIRHAWWKSWFLIIISAIQMLDDPYCFYIFFLPMALALFFTQADKRRVVKTQAIYLIASYIVWKILAKILLMLGIHEFAVRLILPLHTFFSTIGFSLMGVVSIFGNEQISGHYWPCAATFALLCLCITGVYWLYRRDQVGQKEQPFLPKLALVFGPTIIAVNFVLYVLSGSVIQNADMRYLIGSLMGFAVTLVGLWCLSRGNTRHVIEAMLFAFILLNVSLNLHAAAHQPTVSNIAEEQEIVNFADKHNVKVGLADYWDADITTYYAQGKVNVLPVVCIPPKTLGQYYWVTNMSNFLPGELDTIKSRFFVFVNTTPGSTGSPKKYYASSACTVKDIENMFPSHKLSAYKLGVNQSMVIVN